MEHMPITGPADHMISNYGWYPNPPPQRYTRRPWLIWQGSRDMNWIRTTEGFSSHKGAEYVVTDDMEHCQGCRCPVQVSLVSSHIVQGLLAPPLPARLQGATLLRASAAAAARELALDAGSEADTEAARRLCQQR